MYDFWFTLICICCTLKILPCKQSFRISKFQQNYYCRCSFERTNILQTIQKVKNECCLYLQKDTIKICHYSDSLCLVSLCNALAACDSRVSLILECNSPYSADLLPSNLSLPSRSYDQDYRSSGPGGHSHGFLWWPCPKLTILLD